jgi:2-polyprenyl-3-methyl-5-hydroxy-6-metoxy-1,4-benzoquinol methylase
MATGDYTYHDYSTPDPPHHQLYLDGVLSALRSRPDTDTILDAGCCDGNFTQSISVAGYTAYRIDLSEGGIAKATERYPDCTFALASVYDDIREIFPGVQAFDAIVAVEVIEHLYDPRRFVGRVERALSPGGLAIVTTPYWGYLKNMVLAVTNRIDRAHSALWDGGHIKHWSRRTLRALFEERGFELVRFQGAGRPIPGLGRG